MFEFNEVYVQLFLLFVIYDDDDNMYSTLIKYVNYTHTHII